MNTQKEVRTDESTGVVIIGNIKSEDDFCHTPTKDENSPAASPAATIAAAPKAAEEAEAATEKSTEARPLHRTCPIFLRNLAPNITKQEVEEVGKGWLRS